MMHVLQKCIQSLNTLLQVIGEKLKIDASYIAKGGFWLFLGKVSISFAAFVQSILFAYFLSEATFGIYRYVLSFFNIAIIFSLTGMHNAYVQSVAKGEGSNFRNMLLKRIKWGGIGSLLLSAIGVYYVFAGNMILGISFFTVAIFVPLYESLTVFIAFFNAKKRFRSLAISQMITATAVTIGLGVTLWFTNVVSVLLAVVLGIYVCIRYIYTKKVFAEVRDDVYVEVDTEVYGKQLTFMQIIPVISREVDRIILFQFLGPASVAQYTFALVPVNQVNSGFDIVGRLGLPKFSAHSIEQIKKHIGKKMLYIFLLSVMFVVLYIVLAPMLFAVFLPKYTGVVVYSQVLALSNLFLFRNIIPSILIAQKKVTALYAIRLFQPILYVATFMTVVPLFGLWGAVWAWVGVNVVSTVFNLVVFHTIT